MGSPHPKKSPASAMTHLPLRLRLDHTAPLRSLAAALACPSRLDYGSLETFSGVFGHDRAGGPKDECRAFLVVDPATVIRDRGVFGEPRISRSTSLNSL